MPEGGRGRRTAVLLMLSTTGINGFVATPRMFAKQSRVHGPVCTAPPLGPEANLEPDKMFFYVETFIGAPLLLIAGTAFRRVNGREDRSDAEIDADPIVKALGGRAGVDRLRQKLRERSPRF